MLRLAHILNPTAARGRDDLRIAQPITFESMRVARQFAEGKVAVDLLSAQFPEDREAVPEGFRATRDLDRSVLDLGTFTAQRKLPLLRDILDRAYEESDADYLIYTNADIAVMPYFYVSVADLFAGGRAAVTITRRTLPKYERVDQLPLMYAELGERHPGFDCFVFRRDLYPKFVLGDLCIGAQYVARPLLWNIELFDGEILHHLHLTFHLGDDRLWLADDQDEYRDHNRREFEWVAEQIGRKIVTSASGAEPTGIVSRVRRTGRRNLGRLARLLRLR